MGKRLAKMAVDFNSEQPQRYFLQDVHTAVNVRTAGHLGLTLKKSKDYDLAFPPQ